MSPVRFTSQPPPVNANAVAGAFGSKGRAIMLKCIGARRHRVWGIGPQAMRALVALCAAAVCALLTCPAASQTYQVLHSFKGEPDGAYPQASLTMDASGNLYGTTYQGGLGFGTVFKRDLEGHQTVLYSFKGASDGSYPLHAGVILDSNGNFYGTTFAGGAHGYGTVFKLTSSGKETILYSFSGSSGDGAYPYAGLVRDSAGNLYGTTAFGGGANYCGVVYKISSTGKETVLYRFADQPDGANPYSSLIRDSAGNLYGTTYRGGQADRGTIFKITSSDKEAILYNFTGAPGDGSNPYSELIRDSAGNFYGTTYVGGKSGLGTVYELNAQGVETVLYNFTGLKHDGSHPYAGVVRDSSGNLFGTTYDGGDLSCSSPGCGMVFELNSAGKETVLHIFEGHRGKFTDGSWPFAGLVRDSAGNLYGTTNKGGKYSPLEQRVGTVFKLTP